MQAGSIVVAWRVDSIGDKRVALVVDDVEEVGEVASEGVPIDTTGEVRLISCLWLRTYSELHRPLACSVVDEVQYTRVQLASSVSKQPRAVVSNRCP